ncbi:hypothetical protein BU26DRAFT_104706 [Trematosphaeria pertusa]|uniref:Uncharacterized protein n=1 Tax=Trematosphaeria pertusa TaxID=390896 RepID=A0A6A6I1X6_9PLEO|nr:uncharacterized protein BU26DRAFT_104706 [Trematosphaeria pertusa]KAF2243580.1 hypothetical protein BU26DRAFT_104706 [Trematosphaeria pertusa]
MPRCRDITTSAVGGAPAGACVRACWRWMLHRHGTRDPSFRGGGANTGALRPLHTLAGCGNTSDKAEEEVVERGRGWRGAGEGVRTGGSARWKQADSKTAPTTTEEHNLSSLCLAPDDAAAAAAAVSSRAPLDDCVSAEGPIPRYQALATPRLLTAFLLSNPARAADCAGGRGWCRASPLASRLSPLPRCDSLYPAEPCTRPAIHLPPAPTCFAAFLVQDRAPTPKRGRGRVDQGPHVPRPSPRASRGLSCLARARPGLHCDLSAVAARPHASRAAAGARLIEASAAARLAMPRCSHATVCLGCKCWRRDPDIADGRGQQFG